MQSSPQNQIIWNALAGALTGGIVAIFLIQNPTTVSRITGSTPSPSAAQQQLPLPGTNSYEDAVIASVAKAQPAVVTIVVSKDVPIIERYFSDPFSDFFGNGGSPFQFRIPRLEERGTERREIGGGSGFIISSDGLIVTNRHVVDDEEADYTVFLNDGTQYEATVVARDPVNDVAIIRIQATGLPSLEFSNSDGLRVGQSVIAIGNALGEFENTVSTGVVSGLSRSIRAGDFSGQSEQLDEVIQTDAAINPGNSGGPLIDLTGNVVGVNVAVALGSQNVGFALPSNLVDSIVDSVQRTGKIERPFLGVRYIPITPALQEANNLPVDYGVLITKGETAEQLAVIPGSPANKAGITEGDIILEIDGRRLDEDTSLATVVRNKQIGEQVEIKLLSKGEERTVTATLEAAE